MPKKRISDDSFLKTDQWRMKRANILRRDNFTDQYLLKTRGIMRDADTVHHILPREQFPQYAYADWNLISLSTYTHAHIIHNSHSGALTKAGKNLMLETAWANGINLTETVLVIGLPGSGKTEYVRSQLGEDAIAYDLDSIAGAFRLKEQHAEYHPGARRMANSLFKAFAMRAKEFAPRVYLIRTAPSLEEVSLIRPDRVVVCTGRYQISHRKDFREIDEDDLQRRIEDVKTYCEKNFVDLEFEPPLNR